MKYSLMKVMTITTGIVAFIGLIFNPTSTIAAQASEQNQATGSTTRSAIPLDPNQVVTRTDTDPLQTLAKALQQWHLQLSLESSTRKREADDNAAQLALLNELKIQIAEFDAQVMSEFDEVEAYLREQHFEPNLSDEMMARHFAAVAHYAEQRETLLKHLESIEENADDTGQLRRGTRDTFQYIKSLTPNKHVPFEPKNLATNFPTGGVRTPLETKADFQQLFGLDIGETTTLRRGVRKNQPPSDLDLAPTQEVQMTAEEEALAKSLEYNPLKLYLWVKNNIAFTPSHSAIKGSALTLETKSGNAFDIASLLISLLRISKINAKYVYGTIEVSADKIVNWLKVNDINEAMDLLSNTGIPHRALVSAGQVKSIRLEHVWVDAFLDYYPSRGAIHRKGDIWVPVDASYKMHTFHPGLKLEEVVPFDQQRFLAAVPTPAENQDWITGIDEQQIEAVLDEYDTQMETYLEQNQLNIDLADTLDRYEIVPEQRPNFSMGLPYRLITKGATFATLPGSLRYSITIKVYDSASAQRLDEPSLKHTISLPNLNKQRLGMSYEPATESDAIALQNARDSDLDTLPAYLFTLKPVLKLEETVLATGTEIGMGESQYLTIMIDDPARQNRLSQKAIITAGTEIVIGVNGNGLPKQLIENRFSTVAPDSAAENLHQMAISFWWARDFFDDIAAQIHGVRRVRMPSVGLFSSPLSVSYFYGIPRNGIYKQRTVDVKQNIQAVAAPNPKALFEFASMSGIQGSYLENSIMELLFDYELGHGVSATQVLLEANRQNIPIYTITQQNLSTVLPLLSVSQEVKTDIINGVHAGGIAIVPQTEIEHNNWRGAGYIIQDSVTGVGAYLLEGGLNGGALEAFPGCEIAKDPMNKLVKAVVQAIELYYGLVSMISMGNFASAAIASSTLQMLLVSIRAMLRAMVKKKAMKKTRKKSKRKGRKQCSCGGLGGVRKSKPKKELCLELVSLAFGAEHPKNYLTIWRDEEGKRAEKIDELVWKYQNTEKENDKNRMGYVSGARMKINKAKFRINQRPKNWKQTSVTITGQVNTPQGNKTLTFEDERAEVIGNYVITHPMSANTHLAKKRTQFFNPMTIEWSVKYKSTGGLPKTKTLGVSRHKIYVTLNKPSQELGKLYLSLLHWATSNPGATTKPKVVQKTWQHFASKKLTAWDGKRKFFYYKIGGLSAGDRPSNCLISSIPYAACGDFADLLIDSLMVNHAEVGSQVIFVSPYRDQKMLIKEWIPISTTPTVISDKGYKWKFSLYKGHDGKGSMVSSKGKGFPNNKYGDLLNLNGISGQNIETPVEKVFSSHTIVKLPSNSLPPELVDTPYFDPSYGVTYRDEEDFENKAVYGYAKEIERTGEIIQYEVREKPVPNLPHNIQFEVDMKF